MSDWYPRWSISWHSLWPELRRWMDSDKKLCNWSVGIWSFYVHLSHHHIFWYGCFKQSTIIHLRQLLALGPRTVANLQFHELAALVYRDNINIKHDNRKRLAEELVRKKRPEILARKARMKALADQAKPSPNLLAEIIIEHLLVASGTDLLGVFDHVTVTLIPSLWDGCMSSTTDLWMPRFPSMTPPWPSQWIKTWQIVAPYSMAQVPCLRFLLNHSDSFTERTIYIYTVMLNSCSRKDQIFGVWINACLPRPCQLTMRALAVVMQSVLWWKRMHRARVVTTAARTSSSKSLIIQSLYHLCLCWVKHRTGQSISLLKYLRPWEN